MFGRPILFWIVIALIAIGVFIVAQWAIPLLFEVVEVAVPSRVVNVLALLLALGVVYGGYSRGVVA